MSIGLARSPHVDIPGLSRPTGALDLGDALAPYRGPWSARLAAHLLRRAGFGGYPSEIARTLAQGRGAAVEGLLAVPSAASIAPPENLFDVASFIEGNGGLAILRSKDVSQKRMLFKQVRMQELRSIFALQQWWLQRMLRNGAPLQERMAFYFHGHFTTASMQKGVTPTMTFAQNQLFRSYALGNLRDLTKAIS
ncbi:MAG TPA: DUF1800 family protein, partial [Candidatus Dormibacteraeota bacterium]|nr:DUF1800 family protein [Candidatus Dormibacteraeota bacterium]